jgi:glycosyltransferase involved in cell wall biosynthesis
LTAGDQHLIWMAGVSWDGIRGTDRHLATAMTRHARMLWVDPPVSPLTPARLRYTTGRSFRPRLCVLGDRLARLTPVALPGLGRPGVRATTARLVRSQVRWALRQSGIRPFAVVATSLEDLLGHWDDDVVNVLYGTDDYVAGASLMGQSARRRRQQELRALARADVVAAVSPPLARRWAGLGASPVLIPNGRRPANTAVHAIPPAARALPRPVVGLIGQLSERIDLDVLEAIAAAGLSLLIVGPLDSRWEQQRFAELAARPHVHYAGPVPPDVVPSYLAALDVGITPYRDTPFNRASFPLKTLEYLGAGLPVVSTDIPAARWLRADLTSGGRTAATDQVLALAHGSAEFVSAVMGIAGRGPTLARADGGASWPDRDHARASQCEAFAARHTWPRRADALASAIGLPPRPPGTGAPGRMT